MTEIAEKISKLENLLQEPNIWVTRNDPLDQTSLAVYKGKAEILQ